VVIWLLVGWSPISRADTSADKKRATTLLQEGAKLLDKKEFAAALERFTDAYRLVASAKIQFNIGLAQEGLNRPAEAIRAYRIYTAEATSDLAARRADARIRIDALRPHVTLVQISADVPDATVSIDGVEEGHAPLAQPAVVNPGLHLVAVQSPAGGAPWTRTIRGEPGAKLDVVAVLAAPPPLPVPPLPPALAGAAERASDQAGQPTLLAASPNGASADQPPPIYKRAWFWGVVAGVVAAGVVGVVLATRGGSTTYPCDFQPTCLGSK
jgi:hypothetical protein